MVLGRLLIISASEDTDLYGITGRRLYTGSWVKRTSPYLPEARTNAFSVLRKANMLFKVYLLKFSRVFVRRCLDIVRLLLLQHSVLRQFWLATQAHQHHISVGRQIVQDVQFVTCEKSG